MKFAEILSDLLLENNLNQSEFAKKIEVKPSQVSEWLKSKANPGYETLKAISTSLGISADYLLGLEYDFGVHSAHTAAPMGECLTASERELLSDFRRLSPYLQGIALNTVRGLTGASAGDLHKKA